MELTPEKVQAVNILLNAVQVAQSRGAFSLSDAHTIQEAVDRLVPREEQERQEEQEQEVETVLDDSDSQED
jgi:hypothetical protein